MDIFCVIIWRRCLVIQLVYLLKKELQSKALHLATKIEAF